MRIAFGTAFHAAPECGRAEVSSCIGLDLDDGSYQLDTLQHRLHGCEWCGCTTIRHGELLKLGIDIAQSTVAKYMLQRLSLRSPGWRALLRNQAGHIVAVDLFVVPTIGFGLLYGLVILHLERRRLVWTNVTATPTAEWIARQITEAFPWDEPPRYLIRDRDSSYGVAVTRRLRAMGIRDRPVEPRSPWQNAHVERLNGSIRRECLDHVVVLGERHLRRLLASYCAYHNEVRLNQPRRPPDRRHGPCGR